MIIMLWSTIRPETMKTCYNVWKNNASNFDNTKIKIVTDSEEHKSLLTEFDDVIVVDNGDRPGITKPLYELTKNLECDDNDIIVLCSDDFIPPKNWDTYITEELKDFDGCLLPSTGKHDFSSVNIVTIPIMTFGCLKKHNKIIYHPCYYHMNSDTELYDDLYEMNLLKDLRTRDDFIFVHYHWTDGKRAMDEHDKLLHHLAVTHDGKLYQERKTMTLIERMKL